MVGLERRMFAWSDGSVHIMAFFQSNEHLLSFSPRSYTVIRTIMTEV